MRSSFEPRKQWAEDEETEDEAECGTADDEAHVTPLAYMPT
jgi:hypothetical protein